MEQLRQQIMNDFYNIFTTGIIERLFPKFNKDCDKVKCALDFLNENILFKDYNPFHMKNNEKATEYRKEGNTHFSLNHTNYLVALECYNKSICYAELNTECLAIGYANRSAVYYKWKLYQKCLENIELAFEACTNLSDKLCAKLENRKKMCLDKILHNIEPTDECEPIVLSYPAHSHVPFVAECLKMDRNYQFGRLIKTTRDLYPGDCVIIEQPTATTVEPELIYKRCAQCLIENSYSLVPCQHCTGRMFCSPKCRDTAYESYHRFECTAINGLNSLFESFKLAALNVVLRLFSNIKYLDKTITYLNDFKIIDSYNFDYNSDYDYADEYKMLHSLVTNESMISNKDIFQHACDAAVMYKFLKTNKYLKEIFGKSTPDRNYEELFLTLLFHNLKTAYQNFHSLSMFDKNVNDLAVEFGTGAFPFSSLLNHSCAPNVCRFNLEHTLDNVYIVVRKITKNEQLFIDYDSVHHFTTPKFIRQMHLQKYYFKCNCLACQQNWPLVDNLVLDRNLPWVAVHPNESSWYDRVYAKQLKLAYADYLKAFSQHYPAGQVCIAEVHLRLCLLVLYKKRPLHTIYRN